jgi:hypothetical protein
MFEYIRLVFKIDWGWKLYVCWNPILAVKLILFRQNSYFQNLKAIFVISVKFRIEWCTYCNKRRQKVSHESLRGTTDSGKPVGRIFQNWVSDNVPHGRFAMFKWFLAKNDGGGEMALPTLVLSYRFLVSKN